MHRKLPTLTRTVSIFAFLAPTIGLAESNLSVGKRQPALSIDSVDVLRRANRSTVEIHARRANARATARSSGAGVIVSADGYILTAWHVVRDFPEIEVDLSDGRRLPAVLVVGEESLDVAILKVESRQALEPAYLAPATRIQSGRLAIVIGNPGGSGQTIVHGKLGRTRMVTWDGNRAPLRVIEADVVPGNSGGGAFDRETGELLGITVAKSSTLEHCGYVVSSDQLMPLLAEYRGIREVSDAREVHELLGVSLRPVSVQHDAVRVAMLVTAVHPGSPAEQAGWSEGDVLVGLSHFQVQTIGDAVFALRDQPDAAQGVRFLLFTPTGPVRGELGPAPIANSPILAQQSPALPRPF